MKKLFTLASIILISVMSVAAQATYAETSETTVSSSKTPKKRCKSGLEVNYVLNEDSDAHIVGVNLVLGFLALGGEYSSYSDENLGIDDSTYWSLSAGINKRIFILGRFLYADARLGAFYHNTSTTQSYTSYTSEYFEDNGYGCYANPRVGVSLGNFAVTAGYRWNFYDFKFEPDYMSKYMTVGIAFLF